MVDRCKNNNHIPPHYILPVKYASQGYPESPRPWAKNTNNILTDNNVVNTTHTPYLYSGTIEGSKVYFFRQVDNVAMSAPTKELTNKILSLIQSGLKESMKMLGKLEVFNGLNIIQDRHVIRVSCKSYMARSLKDMDGWNQHISHHPLPCNMMRKFSMISMIALDPM